MLLSDIMCTNQMLFQRSKNGRMAINGQPTLDSVHLFSVCLLCESIGSKIDGESASLRTPRSLDDLQRVSSLIQRLALLGSRPKWMVL